MIELRPYQQTAVNEIREALVKYRRVLFQAQTAFGKTIAFSYIALSSQKYKRKVLILSNRTEILNQNGGSLQKMGLDIDYISPEYSEIPQKDIAVGMAQTLRHRIESKEWRDYVRRIEFLIVDEAHCCDFDFIYDYISDSCFRLLVTATPCRQGKQRQLGELVRAMVTGISTKELISKGFLTPARHFSIAAPKLDDVDIDSKSKDYNQKSLAKKFEDKTVYYGVIDEWFRICPDRKTLMFCVSSTQAIECTKIFVERGVNAKYVLSGKFEDDSAYSGKRSEVFKAFMRGEFQVLVNVGIAVAGTDIPDIGCIIANFATTSMSKWRQAIGRGCRISPGKKDFFILDAGDNIRRLGFFETDIVWSLWHDESAGGGIQQMKECPADKMDINHKQGCGAMIPASCKICPACGFKFHTDKDLIQLHLEEVIESDTSSLVTWAAKKRLEGWTMAGILIHTCIANPNEMKKAFTTVYLELNPQKTPKEANKYYHVFMKQFEDKIKKSNKDK